MIFKKYIIFSIALLYWFSLSNNTFGQQLKNISGTISDQQTGQSLPGATIQIKNTNQGSSSNLDGEFKLSGIREKVITLIITYIGYNSDSLIVDFSKSNTQNIQVKLKPASTELGLVQITGEAKGQTKAFIDQKTSANIKNVVSAEQIRQFPDMNAAEVLQRVPGVTIQRDQGEGRYVQLRGTAPELTTFNINGEQIPSPKGGVRYVGMDIISADQIETIEISKVLTPDMDGDGIGGTVNIRTKKASTFIPEISAGVALMYSNLLPSFGGQFQFSYGQRYKKFGFFLNSSYLVNNFGSDNMVFKYAKGPFWGSQEEGEDNYHVQFREFQLSHYEITRKRIGFSTTFDYQFNPKSMIYLRGMYNNFSDDELRRRKVYELDDAVSETLYLYGGLNYNTKARVKIQNIMSLNLGGEQQFNNARLDYETSYALATEFEPDRMEIGFDNPGQAITMKVDLSDPYWPRMIFPNPENAQNAFAYDQYDLSELLFKQSEVTDKNLTAKANLNIPYLKSNASKGYVQFGGKVRFKEKQRDLTAQEYGAYFEDSDIYPDDGPPLNLVTIGDGFSNTNLLNQGYVLENTPGPTQSLDFYKFNQHHFIYDRTATWTQTYGQDYYATEQIYAAYAMVEHNFNRLMLLGGIRYEKTDIDYQGIKIITDKGRYAGMDSLFDKRTHQFLLPQVQMKYRFNENTNIRAAITYTYARPNFDDVLPNREVDDDVVRYGNPDLEYPTSFNIDFLAEKYLIQGQGILSGGLFYKNINNFVFYYTRFAHEGNPQDYGLVEIIKPVNGNKSFVFGTEIMAQSKFWFLPDIWKNFGLYMNYTFTYSEAYINKRFPANYTDAIVIFDDDNLSLFTNDSVQERISLPGQSPNTTNLALFYESERLYVKFTANYHASFLNALGADSDLDEFYNKAWHLDFTANYFLAKNINIFVDLFNLTNAPLVYYVGIPERIEKKEFYSFSARIGFKFNFN